MSEQTDIPQGPQKMDALREPETKEGTTLVRPDKNIFLLFSLLNATNQASGDVHSNPLRQKVFDHFSGYTNTDLNPASYVHESKAGTYVLTLHEAPDFTPNMVELTERTRTNADAGRTILKHLIQFYTNTDFEEFYQTTLPEYQASVENLKNLLNSAQIESLLDQVWGRLKNTRNVIIPNPLAQGSFGPQIGDTFYQIVGSSGTYGRPALHSIAHEASHPRAKAVLEPVRGNISEASFLLETTMADPKYPREYDTWEICFEEHFIRAIQAVFIDPQLIGRITERAVETEKNNGMVLIDTFIEEFSKFKLDTPELNLRQSALNILRNLKK